MAIPVIFSIGSQLGPGGFASLQAGIGMIQQLGAQVVSTIKDLDKFANAYKRLEIDISKADASTLGMIDTMELMASANKFTIAGMKLNAEQFEAVAKAAVTFARSTGIEATDAMRRLTESISKGSTRALKEIGIDLENTEDLLLAQAEAIQKVTEKFGDATIETVNFSESLYALKNNIGTTSGLTWSLVQDYTGLSSIFTSINEIMVEHNTMLDQLNRDYLDLSVLIETKAYDAMILFYRALGMVHDNFSVLADDMTRFREYQRNLAPMLESSSAIFQGGMTPEMQGSVFGGAAPVPTKKTTARAAGGGGGRAALGEEMTFTEEDVFGEQKTLAERVDEQIAAESALAENRQVYMDAQLEQQEQLAEMRLRLLELNNADNDALMAQREHIDNIKLARMEEMEVDAQRIELTRQIMAAERERHYQEMTYVDISRQRWEESMESRLEMGAYFFNRMSLMQQTGTEAGFAIGKAASIAETTINTISGAMAAYKAMAGIPYVGPVLGAAAAAAVTAAGVAAVAKIARQKFNPKGGSVASIGGSTVMSTGGGGGGGYQNVQNINQTQNQQVQVTVYLGEDNVYNAVEREDDRRSQRGARSFRG